jgi:hypothetical protein
MDKVEMEGIAGYRALEMIVLRASGGLGFDLRSVAFQNETVGSAIGLKPAVVTAHATQIGSIDN